ncbi:MAG: PD-(D/E)XK nuclease family protein [Burkholderiaceae bacterium]|nr:PD-(D/E)XK nuclease family protein [Burkholderiaceae bacterium]
MESLLWLLLLAALVAAGLLAAARRQRGALTERLRDALPQELQAARLFINEPRFPIRRHRPYPVAARPDRVYRLPDGSLALLEIKTRAAHAVHPSDIAQLSVQRYAMLGTRRLRNVLPTGYIATVSTVNASVRVHRVDLLSEQQTISLIARYDAVAGGREAPRWPEDLARCRGCPHRQRCSRPH